MVIPLSDRVPGRASGPSQSRVDDGGGLQYVFWKIDRVLRVFHQGEYIGRGAMSEGGPGAHTLPRRGLGVACTMGGVAALWPPSVSALDSVSCREK
jgi:hypothetical protein